VIVLPILARKMFRDLWRTRAQGATVVVLIALGAGLMIGALSMRTSLRDARDDYYAANRLADLQVALVRAPARLVAPIEAIAGVQAVQVRVVSGAILELDGDEPPVTARLVSLDRGPEEAINRPWLTAGRWPSPLRTGEVLVNEAFATARGLSPGDRLPALIRGQRASLEVVGIANSPEFVFASPPGELFPQPERFAIIWMPRRALEQAAAMEGAFNDVVLRLGPGASPASVGTQLETLLDRYGAQPAQGRDRIPSARFLDQEIDQLATMATLLPPAFLAVAAFLLNIVLGRLIEAERPNIGLMKAFGYRPIEVGLGYAGFALMLTAMGLLLGIGLGAMLGAGMAELYGSVYRLPALPFSLALGAIAVSSLVALAAATVGALNAIRRVLVLPPAQALAPAPPPAFQVRGIGIEAWLAKLEVPARIVIRRIIGSPRRSATTVLGIACALALLVLSSRFPSAIDQLLSLTFTASKQQDVTLTFVEAQGRADVLAAAKLPGVSGVEPFRHASAAFSANGVEIQEVLTGLATDARLERLIDVDGRHVPTRDDGIILTAGLARALGVAPGDRITVGFSEGRQRRDEVTVVGVVRVTSGMGGYIGLDALQRLLGEPGRVSGVHARLDPDALTAFNRSINATPGFAGVSFIAQAETSMRKTFNEGSGFMSGLFITFSVLMAGGIAYATASVTLAEQRRDLATLKVLGFTRAEVSTVLVAEVLVLALASIPLGWWLGQQAAVGFLDAMATDLFTFPEIRDNAADVRSAAIVMLAVGVSLFVVRREIDRIDLVESLKSRE